MIIYRSTYYIIIFNCFLRNIIMFGQKIGTALREKKKIQNFVNKSVPRKHTNTKAPPSS